jgi:capsular polysaccharide biosynthesis protein
MRALIVATTADALTDVRRAWEGAGIQTDLVTDVEAAGQCLLRGAPDLVVLDGSLSRHETLYLYETTRCCHDRPPPPVIFSRSSVVPPGSAAHDYYLPAEAEASSIDALGRELLGLGHNGHGPPSASAVIAARPPANGSASGRSRTGPSTDGARTNGTSNEAFPDARPARPGRARSRALRGRPASTGRSRLAINDLDRTHLQPATSRVATRAAARSDMSLLGFLLRWWWLVLLTSVVGGGGGVAFLTYGPLKYQSTALLMIQPRADVTGEPLISTNPQRSSESAAALAAQAASPSVYDSVSRALTGQLEISSDDISLMVLNGQIQISPSGGSSFITVTASDPDPNRAWLLADGYARGFLQDLTVQTRTVAEKEQANLRTQISVLQQQLPTVPLNFTNSNNAGAADTYLGLHAHLLSSLFDAQAKLATISQLESPLVRYGETGAPTQTINEKRVIGAGVAVGGALGMALAYLGELLRQWRRRRRLARQRRRAAKTERTREIPPAAALADHHDPHAPRLTEPVRQEEGHERWVGSARV